MKFSEAWLREWVSPDISRQDLLEQLTMAGLEVESADPVAGAFSDVVVAKVTDVAPHPDADKLSVCSVDDGAGTHQVVCGAPNVRPGLVSAWRFQDQAGKAARRGVERHAVQRRRAGRGR